MAHYAQEEDKHTNTVAIADIRFGGFGGLGNLGCLGLGVASMMFARLPGRHDGEKRLMRWR